MSAINEVYANNILPRQIIERISFADIEPTDEAILEERMSFLEWLNKREERFGRTYSSQLHAWEAYDGSDKMERETSKALEFAKQQRDDIIPSRTWEDEIREILESLAMSNSGNYSEAGGQL